MATWGWTGTSAPRLTEVLADRCTHVHTHSLTQAGLLYLNLERLRTRRRSCCGAGDAARTLGTLPS